MEKTFSNDIIYILTTKGYSREMIEQALGISSAQRTKIMRMNRNISLAEFFTLLSFVKTRMENNFGEVLIHKFIDDLIELYKNSYLISPKNYWNEAK